MSREEAVESYTAGRISRRSFIRHLVAAGVSVGAAVTYAEVLAPSRTSTAHAATTAPDLYPDYPDYPAPPAVPGAGSATSPAAVRVQPRLTG